MKTKKPHLKLLKNCGRYGINKASLVKSGRAYTRMLVRIRDKFTCQDCGAKRTPKELAKLNENCRALLGRKKLFDIHHTHGLCGKNSRGYDSVKNMNTLVTLCHSCHYKRPEHNTHTKEFAFKMLAIKSPDAIAEILARCDRGENKRQIAQDFGVSLPTVYKILRRRAHYMKIAKHGAQKIAGKI